MEKTNTIEKGVSTVLMESVFIRGIKKYFGNVKFDLVLYSTPPITLVGAVEYVKRRDRAKTYLLLKDIFPQNAVDIGMLSKSGPKGLLYRLFRAKEKRLYALSDRIGCMSPANVEYVLRNNPELKPSAVEVCPNSVEIMDKSVDAMTRAAIREKYGIPKDKTVFVYGGNLGRPQGVPFIIECLKRADEAADAFFLIVGNGTEYAKIEDFCSRTDLSNVKLMKRLPKDDYDTMVGACDVGLLFMDHRFTIPNFPSRILSYMQAKLPVLACTDPNTDVGKIIVDNGFGWWCESKDPDAFLRMVHSALESDLPAMGECSWQVLHRKYDVQDSYAVIINSLSGGKSR